VTTFTNGSDLAHMGGFSPMRSIVGSAQCFVSLCRNGFGGSPDYKELLQLFNEFEVDYSIVGSFAIMKYGEPQQAFLENVRRRDRELDPLQSWTVRT